jgi:hypothetical protein
MERALSRALSRPLCASGGNRIPRTGISALWREIDGTWVDSIGLSASELWAALPAEHRSIYFSDPDDDETMFDAETIITNIEASEYLNNGGELVGSEAKGYAQYADNTEQAILDKAYKYFGFYLGPMVFWFASALDVEPSATNVESSVLTIPKIIGSKSYTVTGGTASKNGGAYSDSGSVVAEDTIKLCGNASADFETTATVTLSFTADDSTFSITTRAAITTPSAFFFTDVTEAEIETLTESDAITIAGIEVAVAFTVTGGEAEKNDSGTWATSGTVEAGDTVKLRLTSSDEYETAVSATLTVGGVSDTFTVTTAAYVEPSAGFPFTLPFNLG